jgi:hypothetical protein
MPLGNIQVTKIKEQHPKGETYEMLLGTDHLKYYKK